ncbi:M16 family metallopeptidase [Parvibaculum sedimenti]|uniref:M16 family metallopeptidase n=1 Tax=Parvibaculum sedimenti TaxID=2608632 RepID=UPI001FE6E524|nr:pitrilysin family protein [Parvibaculum sedimenti]
MLLSHEFRLRHLTATALLAVFLVSAADAAPQATLPSSPAASAQGAEPGSDPRPVAQDPRAPEMFRLANGMGVLVIPDHRAPVVTHMVWYRVGAADETPGKTGLAHFLEHLMFKGTEKIAPGEFSKTIARNGGQDNAFTNYDFTAYYQAIAKDRLPLVMSMEADRMTGLRLTDKEVLPERDVVLEELRMRLENEPVALLQSAMNAKLYGKHPYGRDVIGVKSEVEKLSTADALDFYRRFYTPNNAILIVAGDITGAELKPLAEKYYGSIPDRAPTYVRKRPAVEWPKAPERVTLHDPRVQEPTWLRFYPAPSQAGAGPREAAALDVLAEILGGGTTSRLYQALVVREKVASSVQSWYDGDNLDAGDFGIYALPRLGGNLADAEKAIAVEVARLLKDGVAADELDRAKTQLVASDIYARDTQQTLAYAYGSALMTGVSAREVFEWPDYIRAVTADDVLAAAHKVFDKSNTVTGELLPEEKP